MPVPSTPQDLINLIREKLFNNTSGKIDEPSIREVLEWMVKVLDAKFSFLSPDLTEEQYAQWNIMLDYMVRETKGVLTTSSVAPTEKGKYLLSGAGTYTNLGGLVATADKLNYAYFNGSSWSLISTGIPNASTTFDKTNNISSGTMKAIGDYVDAADKIVTDALFTKQLSKNLVSKIYPTCYMQSGNDLGFTYSTSLTGWNVAGFTVQAGKTYTISGWSSVQLGIGVYSGTLPSTITGTVTGLIKSGNPTYVFGTSKVGGSITFTAPTNAGFVLLTCSSAAEAASVYATLQAEEGSVATEYLPNGGFKFVLNKSSFKDFKIKEINKTADKVLIRTNFNATLDLVREIFLNSNPNGNSYLSLTKLIGKSEIITATGTNIHNHGDSVPAPFQTALVNYSTSYANVGGNHGTPNWEITANSHGKTSADLLSVWKNANNAEFYLVEIISANSLRFIAKPYTDVDGRDKIDIRDITTLTHVSGATNTASITPSAGMAYLEYKPMVGNIDVKLYVDDVLITSDGTYTGNIVRVVDIHTIPDPTQPNLVIPFVFKNSGTMVKNTLIHTFFGNGSYTAESIQDWQKNHKVTNQGILQDTPLNQGSYTSLTGYAMNVGTVNGFDFKNGVNFGGTMTNTTATKSNFTEQTKAVQQLSQILFQSTTPTIGVGMGYNPLVGVGKQSELLQNDEHFYISGSIKKYYPRAYNGRLSGTNIINGIAYCAYYDATKNQKLAADYYVPYGNSNLYFLNIRQAMTKEKIYLPKELLSKEFEIVNSSSTITIHTQTSSTSEGLVISGAVGDWVILKF